MMKETRWHYYRTGSGWHRVKARYGIDYAFARKHNQTPDFTVSGEVEYKSRNNHWYGHSSGQVTSEIAAHIPEIAPYLKWHMVGPDYPMHYFANAKYWFEMVQGKEPRGKFQSADPVESFKRTIKLGAFPGDALPPEIEEELARPPIPGTRWQGPKEWAPGAERRRLPWAPVQAWLEERLPSLQAAWVVDMGELGVLEE